VARAGAIAGSTINCLERTAEMPVRQIRKDGLGTSAAAYLVSLAVVAAATMISWLMYGRLDDANLIMVYLLGTVFVATRYGYGPAVQASFLSVLGFDFFFVPPVFSFEISDLQYLFTLAVMLVVALVICNLAANLRAQSKLAIRIEEESMRNALLSAISHDFRTPLAAIVGASGSLLEDAERLTAEERREFLQTVYDEAQRMTRLANNILDMARLEVGALTLNREWYPPEELVGIALTRLRKRLEARDLRVDVARDLPFLHVDAVMIDAVLENLLENALKYTPQGTPIEIGARTGRGEIEFWVADSGPGLPAGSELQVFEKFHQEAVAGKPGSGAGLGLSICRAIVHAHGGGIVAQNRRDGGAIFRFSIPVTGTPPQIARQDRELDCAA
jgi:two-component system sensor histidine kinase KdpD